MEKIGLKEDEESWVYNDYTKVCLERGSYWASSKHSKILVFFKIEKTKRNTYSVVFKKGAAGRTKIATIKKDRGMPLNPGAEKPGLLSKIRLEGAGLAGDDVVMGDANTARKLLPCGRPGCNEKHFRRNCMVRCTKCSMRCRNDRACAEFYSEKRKDKYLSECANLQVAEYAISFKAAQEAAEKNNNAEN